ncbi:hypothetical protein VOLCADRAFT_93782 [Volvox carteri f. nagariensis]|uniref:Expansin-like EG45 domain-containing protein n=1 Tax=Volvox carteri f. nagariensis TaxID=3068 RepID=D8U316_VOLCA|nr:uncharacterized protein VOLCADRAFT_93782 [Volvox carteri f. nagariensis]EFJ45997.1 hypothetical protein VOLCADRAFT_93782 [Volvox carteri f. nagariensis]|eukprot:XP_002953075.1 hypothetical protein VOLCADRAFT_93782 [Volvox carteri f. nagariensis]
MHDFWYDCTAVYEAARPGRIQNASILYRTIRDGFASLRYREEQPPSPSGIVICGGTPAFCTLGSAFFTCNSFCPRLFKMDSQNAATTSAVRTTSSCRRDDDDIAPTQRCCPTSTSSSSCSRCSSRSINNISSNINRPFVSTTTTSSRQLSALMLLSALLPFSVRADDWHTGRATYYGYDGGASIDQGSCMYGPLPNSMVSTGKNIAALSDQDYDFGGSCGRCYEVACNPAAFSDGYGNYIDRNSGCYDDSKTVIVTITDSCPCNYPGNQYSNRRWCCGDMYHMDLSQDAFSQLADIGQGVMGIRYRQVNCPGGFVPSPRKATSDYLAGTGQ